MYSYSHFNNYHISTLCDSPYQGFASPSGGVRELVSIGNENETVDRSPLTPNDGVTQYENWKKFLV